MIVVSDTSCLSGLFLIGQVNLLGQLYGTIIIPKTVWEEFLGLKAFGFAPETVVSLIDIQIMTPQNRILVDLLQEELDSGESEAIVLAKEINADLLLLDERHGTMVARNMGLKTTGLLGLLLEAKRQNLVQTLKPILADLRNKAGFWLSEALENQILSASGEGYS